MVPNHGLLGTGFISCLIVCMMLLCILHGIQHLNSESVDGCFDAASGMEAIRSVCCSIAQGDQEENHDMFEVATAFTV